MRFVNIHDAKTHLSKYLEQISHSNEIIVICKNGKPIAQLSNFKTPHKRKLGLARHKITIMPDFDRLPDSFITPNPPFTN